MVLSVVLEALSKQPFPNLFGASLKKRHSVLLQCFSQHYCCWGCSAKSENAAALGVGSSVSELILQLDKRGFWYFCISMYLPWGDIAERWAISSSAFELPYICTPNSWPGLEDGDWRRQGNSLTEKVYQERTFMYYNYFTIVEEKINLFLFLS